MKAYVIEGTSGRVKDDVPVPELKSHEVLIRSKTIAINPTDWKHCAWKLGPEGSIVGCDVAGEVVAVGSDVTGVNVGEQYFSFISGASTETPGRGAFAEYVPLDYRYLLKVDKKLRTVASSESLVPAGPVTTFEGAASVPVGLLTVAITLGYSDKLKLEPNSVGKDRFYLVWGGASAVGTNAVQLAKYLGFRVVATCSPRNTELVESLGAEKTFDYHDSDVVGQIKDYVGNKLDVAFDTISTHDTMGMVNEILPTDHPVNMDATLGFEDKIKEKKSNVTYGVLLAYLAVDDIKKFGINGEEIKSPPGLQQLSKELVQTINSRILSNDAVNFRHMPCKVLSDGLDSVNEGLDIVRSGKNSGVKIVINNL